jgi:hypothetical protein
MSENNTARRSVSDLLFNAIVGAIAGMLINLLGSLNHKVAPGTAENVKAYR